MLQKIIVLCVYASCHNISDTEYNTFQTKSERADRKRQKRQNS